MERKEKILEALPEILEMEEAIGFVNTIAKQWRMKDDEVLDHLKGLLGLREEGKTTADLMVSLWDSFGDREAIVSGDKRFTFKEFEERTFKLANGLQSLGAKPKDAIAEILFNGNEFLELHSACSLIGCPMPFVNWHMRGNELAETINRRSPKIVVFDAELMERILEIKDRIESVEHWVVVGGEAEGMLPYEDLIARSPNRLPRTNYILALNPYTAGTTGTPKSSNFYDGVGYLMSDLAEPPRIELKEYMKLLVKQFSFFYWFGGTEIQDPKSHNIRCLIPTPLYHAGTIVAWAPFMLLGGTAVPMRKFDPEEFLRLIEKERINWTFVAPTILQRVLGLPEEVRGKYDLSSMHSLICAAAPCPVDVKKGINELFEQQGAQGPVFHEYYGSSETAMVTVLLPKDYEENPNRIASVGTPRCGELRIYDEEQERWCEPDEEGLVLSRTCTTVSLRYPGSEEKLSENTKIIDGKEWFDDGLLGYMDEDGFLYLTSRKKDLIISGGVNIYPDEIESVILKHPKVFDVAVISFPDEDLGEVPAAIVQVQRGGKMAKEELVDHCEENGLYGFKVPKKVEFVNKLPRHVDGKILKRELEAEYWEKPKSKG